MALGQSSFRRLLLTRLLLLSVPVLLMGVYVTYRKARSAFLETARQNLTESAVRKGESINQSTEALKAILLTASDASVLKTNSKVQHQAFLKQLAKMLPTDVECVQLTDLKTGKSVAGTCGDRTIFNQTAWQKQQQELLIDSQKIEVELVLPTTSPISRGKNEHINNSKNQLRLCLSAPVYDRSGQLRYALSVTSTLLHQQRVEPGSLDGYTVAIDRDGKILAHPNFQRVGHNISEMPDAARLESLLKNAIAEKPDFLHLFFLEKNGVELVAGYTSIPSPLTLDRATSNLRNRDSSLEMIRDRQWIILAVTPIDDALAPLKQIREVLLVMTLGLIGASYLVTLYVARDLARPLEQLRDYTLKEEHLHFEEQIPQDFKIREINQLSIALNEMVRRLRTWGEEILSAWKEAQNANQLKNEFLATTSHELRTPLNGIINCIRVVKEGYCDGKEEELEFLQQADDAAIHLLGIINDVLDISKIEAGKLSVTIEKVNLKKLVNEVIDLQIVQIQNKDLSFWPPQWGCLEHLIVDTDPAKLKQVLINVIGNAVKFTENGKISMSVCLEKYPNSTYTQDRSKTVTIESKNKSKLDFKNPNFSLEKDKKFNVDNLLLTEQINKFQLSQTDYQDISGQKYQPENIGDINFFAKNIRVVITVTDTGIGIDPSQQDKLFRPFVMVDGSTTRKFSGTGLGLAISRNLLELMGGSISLFSAGENRGTTVKIYLPFKDLENSSLEEINNKLKLNNRFDRHDNNWKNL